MFVDMMHALLTGISFHRIYFHRSACKTQAEQEFEVDGKHSYGNSSLIKDFQAKVSALCVHHVEIATK